MDLEKTYQKLRAWGKKRQTLSSILALLEWDQETHMPSSATEFRAEQIALMAELSHKLKSASSFKKQLSYLIDLESGEILAPSLTSSQKAALTEWRKDLIKALKLPSSFVANFAKTTSSSVAIWQEAKKENNFKKFAPSLEKIVSLCQKQATLLGFKKHPYDALLDLYEPECSVSTLLPLFDSLKASLSSLLKKHQGRSFPETSFLKGYFPKEKQKEAAFIILKMLGFSKENSSLDESAHPFCSGIHPLDSRMTTHIHEDNLMPNLFSVLHEAGHALYNQGLNIEEFGSPLGEQRSLGIDESQSRLWETIIGKSKSFWIYFYPHLQALFQDTLGSVPLEDFYNALHVVKPSFIRIDSDETSYCLHIILRFEIELGLIEGSLQVKDIPEIWREKMKSYLGISPSTDREGCLQDIHWAMGSIGYFPTYALGNLYAAQFFDTFIKQHPTWDKNLQEGDTTPLRKWLKSHIHSKGREFSAHDLVRNVTGHPLSEKYFLDHLTSNTIGNK